MLWSEEAHISSYDKNCAVTDIQHYDIIKKNFSHNTDDYLTYQN